MTKTASQKARARSAKKNNGRAPKRFNIGNGRSAPRSAPRSKSGRKGRWSISMFNGNSASVSALRGARNALVAVPSGQGMRPQRQQVATNDEFIANVVGSAGFDTTSYPVNPGLAATFPWGSKMASLFQKYFVQQLEFYYKPTVSNYAVGGSSGKVMLSFNYDASAPSPANKQIVEDTYPHSDAMPYEQCRLNIVPQKQDSMYVRTGALSMGDDIKTFDMGTLSVSVEGSEDDVELGELRVRYTIFLTNPVLDSGDTSQSVIPVVPKTHCCKAFSTFGGEFEGISFGPGTNIIYLTGTSSVGDLPIVTADSPASFTFSLPGPGCYCVDFSATFGSTAANNVYVRLANGSGSAIEARGNIIATGVATLTATGMIAIPIGATSALTDITFDVTAPNACSLIGNSLTWLRIMKMS